MQITHKHYERRLLVAESCGVLAPYIPVCQMKYIIVVFLVQSGIEICYI